MGHLGGGWISRQDLEAGEKLMWSCVANRAQGSGRAVGGQLFATTRRLIFRPHLVDYHTGGQPFESSLNDITMIARQPPWSGGFVGFMMSRLRLTLRNNDVELFVVYDLEKVIQDLQKILPSHLGNRSGVWDRELDG